MAKYNITEKKEKVTTVSYRRSVAPSFVEDVARKIIQKLMVEGNYRDPKYSAKRLADDIGINSRQASAVISLRFQQNYSQLVGNMRVQEAKYMLQEREFRNMKMEDIAINVGFTTRQNFYATFFRQCGMTPKEYRFKYGPKQEASPKPAKKRKKTARKSASAGKARRQASLC